MNAISSSSFIQQGKTGDTVQLSRPARVARVMNNPGLADKGLGILKLVDHLNREFFDSTFIVLNIIQTRGMLDLSRYNIQKLPLLPVPNLLT